jgi:hypothetical protein
MKTRNFITLALAAAAAVGLYQITRPSEDLVIGRSGKKWRVVLLGKMGDNRAYEIFAPAGSWGPHPELSVLRYSQTGADMNSRKVQAVGSGVPAAMMAGAALDFGLDFAGSKVLPLGTSGI